MMYLWFVYAVIFSQMVVLYWLAAPATFRLIYQSYLTKNSEWIANHPEFVRRYAQEKYAIWLSRLLGAVWIAIAIWGLVAAASEQWLIGLLLLSMLVWLVLELTVSGIEYQRVYKKIPLPKKRHASLERRMLIGLANPAWIYAGLSVLAAIGAIYVYAYCRELIDVDLLLWRLGSLIAGAVMSIAFLLYCVRRRKQEIDDALGPRFRRSETLGAIYCLYFFAIAMAVRELQDLFGISLINDVIFFAVASIVLQVFVLFGTKLRSTAYASRQSHG